MSQKCDIHAKVSKKSNLLQCRPCLHFDFQCICCTKNELIPNKVIALDRMLDGPDARQTKRKSLFTENFRRRRYFVLVLDYNTNHSSQHVMHGPKGMLILLQALDKQGIPNKVRPEGDRKRKRNSFSMCCFDNVWEMTSKKSSGALLQSPQT